MSNQPVIHSENIGNNGVPLPRGGAVELRPAAFLDRDGVINLDGEGYNYKTEDLHFVEGAPQAVRVLNERGYCVFVVSNQSGVARGYFDEESVLVFHRELQLRLEKFGAHIDAFAFCPHLPEGTVPEYSIACGCRKPKTGLLSSLVKQWPVDLEHSFMVGDKVSDMECAESFGVKGYRFLGGDLEVFVKGIID